MKIIAIILILIKMFETNAFGQSNQLISTTEKPDAETYPQHVEINSIQIYEQATVVSLKFISWVNNSRISISSETTIKDYYNSNNIYKIAIFEKNELDKGYILGPKGTEWNFILYFPRIAPGIQKINLEIPYRTGGFVWEGVEIKNPDNHPKTAWTEQKLIEYWNINGLETIEGIYENSILTDGNPKYRLAVKKDGQNYQLIYLSGAIYDIWQVGEIKAYIYETATPFLFKGKWFMGNKSPNEDLYISFEQGLMKVLWTDKDNPNPKQIYLKLYPND